MKSLAPLFSFPRLAKKQTHYLRLASKNATPWGGGDFCREATAFMEEVTGSEKVFLTQSCTSALELVALHLDLGPSDEVIVPSYTFVSSVSAFAARGANIKFAEIDPCDLNVSIESIRGLFSPRTRAVVAVHYGGMFPHIQELQKLCREAGVVLIEDAAQSIGSTVSGKHLGTFGDFGCISFHGTKNLSSGEGGALLVNRSDADLTRLEAQYEKGTNRSSYLRGEVDKYTWRLLGSSFIPSEFTAAVLLAQLEELSAVTKLRRQMKANYLHLLGAGANVNYRIVGKKELCEGDNGHMFAVVLEGVVNRERVIQKMRSRGVVAASHYVPLHNSPFASSHLGEVPSLPLTEDLAEKVLRLPIWSAKEIDTEQVVSALKDSIDESYNK